MKLEDLSPELQAKAEACETAEELAKLAESEGVELSDEDIEDIAGGVKTVRRIRPRIYKKPKPKPRLVPQPDSSLPTEDAVSDGE